ncbi:MAG: orotate phosphoribosyltransferase [Alphaproteobacteria bacterium]|nr:orotate phosphoribosyltransferase [Alphaproteobacteria bacterium]
MSPSARPRSFTSRSAAASSARCASRRVNSHERSAARSAPCQALRSVIACRQTSPIPASMSCSRAHPISSGGARSIADHPCPPGAWPHTILPIRAQGRTAEVSTAAQERSQSESDAMRERLRALIQERSVLRGTFTLASGVTSSVFFDLKRTALDAEGMRLIGVALAERLAGDPARYLGGLELGAVPVIMAAGLATGRHALIIRKSSKDHGTRKLIEGAFEPGAEVTVIEDVTTTGGSALAAVKVLRDAGCRVARVVTVVDRLQGAEAAFTAAGLAFDALYTRHDFGL